MTDSGSIFKRINHFFVGEFIVEKSTKRWASLVFMMAAVLIGVATYKTTGWFGRAVSLRPDFLSGIIAVLLVSPLYVRRVLSFASSVYCYLSLTLNVVAVAIIVQALLGKASLLGGLPTPYLIGFAILMTWTGMRQVALLVWAFVVVLGVLNIQSASEAMGLWGFAFILFVVLGVISQVDGDVSQLADRLRSEFRGDVVSDGFVATGVRSELRAGQEPRVASLSKPPPNDC